MILAVHQPHYLPWLGYFHKIAKSDLFILLDDVQYKKREFQNRNKIKTAQGPQWLTIPVLTKGSYHQRINEVTLNTSENWEKQHQRAIELNYTKAPWFDEHKAYITKLYEKKWDRLIDVSMDIIQYALSYLNITTPWELSSPYHLETHSTQRIIDLCKKVGADTYLSGSGGKDYMDVSLFEKNNIALVFQDFTHPEYPQLHGDFIPYLSIFDLFLNCGKKSREVLLNNQ